MTVIIRQRCVGPRSVEFTEPRRSRLVPIAAAALGCRYMRARHGGGWLVPILDAPDIEAYLVARLGATVEVTIL